MNKEQIMQQIDDLVASKTFSLDALEGIKKIKDTLQAITEERDHYKEVSTKQLTRIDELVAVQSQLNLNHQELRKTIVELTEQLRAAQDAVWEKKIAEASAAAYQDAFHTVFKPNAVRETISRNVVKPVTGIPGGNGAYASPGFLQNGTETETITREDA